MRITKFFAPDTGGGGNTVFVGDGGAEPASTPTRADPLGGQPTDGNKVLSTSDAARLLAQRRQQLRTQPAPAGEPPRAPVPEQRLNTPVDKPAASDDLSPAEVEGDDRVEPGEQPALDAPSSFNADEKRLFASLPREQQQAAIRLEASRRTTFSTERQAAENARREAEERGAALRTERQTVTQQLAPLVHQIRASIDKDFADIKGPADVIRMSVEAPARYTQWHAQQSMLGLATKAAEDEAARQESQKAEEHRESLQKELSGIGELVPSWNSEEKVKAGLAELQTYLGKQGYKPEHFSLFTKGLFIATARKAMLYDRAMAKRAEAAKVAEPAAVPSAPARAAGNPARGAEKAAVDRLANSGRMQDAAAALKARREAAAQAQRR